MRLCLALGWVDPDALAESISPRVLYEWMAYSQLEPFGPLVSWWQTARKQAQLANLFRKPHSRPFESSEFMPSFDAPRKKSPQEMYAVFRTWALMSAGEKKAPPL